MKCPRCAGIMFKDRLEDIKDDTGQIYFYAYHCFTCGEILDDMIIGNRSQRPKPTLTRNRKLLIHNC